MVACFLVMFHILFVDTRTHTHTHTHTASWQPTSPSYIATSLLPISSQPTGVQCLTTRWKTASGKYSKFLDRALLSMVLLIQAPKIDSVWASSNTHRDAQADLCTQSVLAMRVSLFKVPTLNIIHGWEEATVCKIPPGSHMAVFGNQDLPVNLLSPFPKGLKPCISWRACSRFVLAL